MLAKIAVALVCAACALAPVTGAQSFSGTFVVQGRDGNPVTLVLTQDAQGKVTGTLSSAGARFEVEAQAEGRDFVGVARSNEGAIYLEGTLEGTGVRVIFADIGPGGQPDYEQAREIFFARSVAAAAAGPGTLPRPARPAGPATGAMGGPVGELAGAGPQDQQIARLLLSSKWCHFSFSGTSDYSGSGSTYQEQALFSADGTVRVSTGSESYYSGGAGSVAGQGAGGQILRWRVRDGTLHLSGDGMQWQPVPLRITQNSNGYPIVNAGGKEYAQCN